MAWLTIVSMAVAWFLQNCTHGISHLVAVSYYHGAKPVSIRPWPHVHRGGFYFCRAIWSWRGVKKPYTTHSVYSAPVIGALVQCVIALAVFAVVFILDKPSAQYVLSFVLAPLVDIVWWFGGYKWGSERSDGQRFCRAINYQVDNITQEALLIEREGKQG